MNLLTKILANIAIIIGLVPVCFLLFRSLRRGFEIEMTAIKPFLWLLFFGSIYEFIFTFVLLVNTAYWFTLYILLEFLGLYYFFRKLFLGKYSGLLIFFLISYTLAWVTVCYFFWEKESHLKIESYFTVAETLFVYIFSVLWFNELFRKAEIISLWKTPVFYFICGFLLYFLGSLFMFLLISDIFKTNPNLILKYWIVSLIFALMMKVLICVGIWKATEPKRTLVKG